MLLIFIHPFVCIKNLYWTDGWTDEQDPYSSLLGWLQNENCLTVFCEKIVVR